MNAALPFGLTETPETEACSQRAGRCEKNAIVVSAVFAGTLELQRNDLMDTVRLLIRCNDPGALRQARALLAKIEGRA